MLAQVLLFNLMQVSSHLGLNALTPPYLPQMTGVTQVTFLQPLPQLLHWMDICPSPGIGLGRNLAGEGDFALAYKPVYALKKQ